MKSLLESIRRSLRESILDMDDEIIKKLSKSIADQIPMYDILKDHIISMSYKRTIGWTHDKETYQACKAMIKKVKCDPFLNAKGKPASNATELFKAFAAASTQYGIDLSRPVKDRAERLREIEGYIEKDLQCRLMFDIKPLHAIHNYRSGAKTVYTKAGEGMAISFLGNTWEATIMVDDQCLLFCDPNELVKPV